MKRIIACALATCMGLLVPNFAGALDLRDFLDLETQQSVDLTAKAVIGGIAVNMTGNMTITEVPSLFVDEPATEVQFVLEGRKYLLTQHLVLRHAYPNLLLEKRVSTLAYDNNLIEYDEEIYSSPIAILPRTIEMDTEYDYAANLRSGYVEDCTMVRGITMHGTGHATEGEALDVDFFAESDNVLCMNLCRSFGIVGMAIDHTLGRIHLTATIDVAIEDEGWPPDCVCGRWDGTTRLDGGWRYCDWFGLLWIDCVDADWIFHYGLGDTYCYGDESGMWIWFAGGGWMWTRSGVYPVVYSYEYERYLLYMEGPNSHTFFDYNEGVWLNL